MSHLGNKNARVAQILADGHVAGKEVNALNRDNWTPKRLQGGAGRHHPGFIHRTRRVDLISQRRSLSTEYIGMLPVSPEPAQLPQNWTATKIGHP